MASAIAGEQMVERSIVTLAVDFAANGGKTGLDALYSASGVLRSCSASAMPLRFRPI